MFSVTSGRLRAITVHYVSRVIDVKLACPASADKFLSASFLSLPPTAGTPLLPRDRGLRLFFVHSVAASDHVSNCSDKTAERGHGA